MNRSAQAHTKLRMGLVVNPFAGIGGAEALKGSDNAQERDQLLAEGVVRRVVSRLETFFDGLESCADVIEIHTWAGEMGAQYVPVHFNTEILGESPQPSCADDTVHAVKEICRSHIDLLVFVGGDGTARNVVDGCDELTPVLGLPSGVKMQSGCFAVTPTAAAEVVKSMISADLVDLRLQEVRDLDEAAYRTGIVKSKFYGELHVPELGQFVQATKVGGIEVEDLVLDEISAEVDERFDEEALWLIGPGTTTRAFMEYKGLDNTLLGVDVVKHGEVVLSDATATQLELLLADWQGPVQVLVTAIGGQGHVFGRGNQQFSPAVLRKVGKAAVTVVMTKTKLAGLNHRPLIIDSNDAELDADWSGFIEVVTGYHDQVIYPISNGL